MPSGIDLLVLDVNGVVYDYDTDARVRSLATRLGCAPSDVQAAFFGSGLEAASDSGAIDGATYLRRASAALGVEVTEDAWAAALADALDVDDDVLSLVSRAAEQVRVITLSNNGLLTLRLHGRFYHHLVDAGIPFRVAAEFGAKKPDATVYLAVCDEYGVDPSRTAFVDDKEANATGGADAGLHAHHFVGRDGLADFLDALGMSTG